MTGQAVAAAAGHNAQCGIGVYQRSCHLIYGAVATHSHYYVNAFFGLLFCYLSSVSSVFSKAYFGVEQILVDNLSYQGRNLGLRSGSRFRVQNKCNFSLFRHNYGANLRNLGEKIPLKTRKIAKTNYFLVKTCTFYRKMCIFAP